MKNVIKASEGQQEAFLKAKSDIVIYGGAAGGGKTFALLLDSFRYAYYPNYSAVIFRRSMTQVKNAGGIWEQASQLYSQMGAMPNITERYFKFPAQYTIKDNKYVSCKPKKNAGGKIQFAHLNDEGDKFSWQGAEIPYIAFDELTHFSLSQFIYLLSRNRNTNGFPNLIRGTCNPDPDSWVKKMLAPWLDEETGYPRLDMLGKELFMVIEDNEFIFGETEEELIQENSNRVPKSITFIPAKITDNPYLAEDKTYLSNHSGLKTTESISLTFQQPFKSCSLVNSSCAERFEKITPLELPKSFKKVVRGWDFAGGTDKEVAKKIALQTALGEKKSRFDYTASVKLGLGHDGYIYILDCTHEQVPSADLISYIVNQCHEDGTDVIVRIPQDPGQAGKFQVTEIQKHLLEFSVAWRTMSSNKITRANAISSRASKGLCKILVGSWNDKFLKELAKFPPKEGSPDIVDALVEAYYELAGEQKVSKVGCILVR